MTKFHRMDLRHVLTFCVICIMSSRGSPASLCHNHCITAGWSAGLAQLWPALPQPAGAGQPQTACQSKLAASDAAAQREVVHTVVLTTVSQPISRPMSNCHIDHGCSCLREQLQRTSLACSPPADPPPIRLWSSSERIDLISTICLPPWGRSSYATAGNLCSASTRRPPWAW